MRRPTSLLGQAEHGPADELVRRPAQVQQSAASAATSPRQLFDETLITVSKLSSLVSASPAFRSAPCSASRRSLSRSRRPSGSRRPPRARRPRRARSRPARPAARFGPVEAEDADQPLRSDDRGGERRRGPCSGASGSPSRRRRASVPPSTSSTTTVRRTEGELDDRGAASRRRAAVAPATHSAADRHRSPGSPSRMKQRATSSADADSLDAAGEHLVELVSRADLEGDVRDQPLAFERFFKRGDGGAVKRQSGLVDEAPASASARLGEMPGFRTAAKTTPITPSGATPARTRSS